MAEKGILKTFTVKLNRSDRGVSVSMEPQIRPGTGAVPEDAYSGTRPAENDVSRKDMEDNPLYRPRVAPQHESIVRRVFSRRAER